MCVCVCVCVCVSETVCVCVCVCVSGVTAHLLYDAHHLVRGETAARRLALLSPRGAAGVALRDGVAGRRQVALAPTSRRALSRDVHGRRRRGRGPTLCEGDRHASVS